eukprot:366021-Chlamydomonas_euryale.AAC.16
MSRYMFSHTICCTHPHTLRRVLYPGTRSAEQCPPPPFMNVERVVQLDAEWFQKRLSQFKIAKGIRLG